MYIPSELIAYNKRAFDSGWDGESFLVYGSALPKRGEAKVQKKKEAAFELTSEKDKPKEVVTGVKMRELQGWEWAKIRKRNKKIKEKIKEKQTTLNFE